MTKSIVFAELDSGSQSGINQALYTIISDQARWESLWKQHTSRSLSPPPAPEVDWDKDMVIIVARGACPSAGYGIEVQRVTEVPGALRIEATRLEPLPGSMQASVVTTPYQFVKVPLTTVRAEFIIE